MSSDEGHGDEHVSVTRFFSPDFIERLLRRKDFVSAVTHSQLLLEKRLLDLVVAAGESERVRMVRRSNFDVLRASGSPTPLLGLGPLIDLAWVLETITKQEHSEMHSFRKIRNRVLHKHGYWHTDAGNACVIEGAIRATLRFLRNHGECSSSIREQSAEDGNMGPSRTV